MVTLWFYHKYNCISKLVLMRMAQILPKLVAFDLDFTLWDLWIDTHVTGPLRRNGDTINEVLDRHREPVKFYPDVPRILHRLHTAGVTIAACSRTEAPRLARQALELLLVEPDTLNESPMPALRFFEELEIYPGSKITHFQNLHEKTGIPYSEMLFFDDEYRNAEVEKLGVTIFLVKEGLNNDTFERGIKKWRARRGATKD